FQAEDGIRDFHVTGVQTCALPISHLFEQVVHLGQVGALEAGEVAQGFAAGELRVEGDVLRQVAEAAAYLRVVGCLAQYPDLSLARGEQAEDECHGGGLAGAVVAEQPQHLALGKLQGQLMQHSHAADALADALGIQGLPDCCSCSGSFFNKVSVGSCISGKLSCTPGDLSTGKARCTQRSSSMPGLFISRRTWGYIHSRRSTLSLGS